MKRSARKVICLLVAMVMLTAASGCGAGNQGTTDPQSSKAAGTAASADTVASSGEPEKLKILTYALGDVEYNENVPVLGELAKRVNMDIEWQDLPTGAEESDISP